MNINPLPRCKLKNVDSNESVLNINKERAHNTMTFSDRTGINASDILKGVSTESKVQNSNAKGGITITKEESSQRSPKSRSRSRSLPQTSSSSQHLQQQQRSHDVLKEFSSSSRHNNYTSSKDIIKIKGIIIQEVHLLHDDHQPP